MPGECWNCGRWLSGGDLLEGYCWDCKRQVRTKDGGYPRDLGSDETGGKTGTGIDREPNP